MIFERSDKITLTLRFLPKWKSIIYHILFSQFFQEKKPRERGL